MTDHEKIIRLLTIGHSNRPLDQFLSLLREFEIRIVADIRSYPTSRKFPHFNREVLQNLLNDQGIEYTWFEALGGRRHTSTNKESPNTGLSSPAFRNYADHMATKEFRTAVQRLLSTAVASHTAVMCAEKLYWKCHRRLLSDYLTARGVEVQHIVEPGKLHPHKLTAGAVITPDHTVLYPPDTTGPNQIAQLFDP